MDKQSKAPDPMDKIYTINDLQKLLKEQYDYNISAKSIYRWVQEGTLKLAFGRERGPKLIRLGDFFDCINGE